MSCHVIATPLNLLSFYLFKKQKSSPTFLVYMLISLTNTWLSIGSFPYTVVMLTGSRDLAFFNNYVFRAVWTVLWEPSIAFSVFLVLMVTTLRTITIVVKRKITVQKSWVIIATASYAAFIWLEVVVMSFFGNFTTDEDAIPYLNHDVKLFNLILQILSFVELAFPVVPLVILTCLTSSTLLKSAQNPGTSNRSAALKKDATVTVITFTVVFIALKLPLFVCFIRWIPFLVTDYQYDIFGGPNVYLDLYSWPVAYIVLIQVNALTSPLIYLSRMTWFRAGMVRLVTSAGLSSVTRASNTSCNEN